MGKYSLTDDHKKQLRPWADKWIANAMSTKPMDENDKSEMVKTIHGMYAAAKLDPPKHIIFVPKVLFFKDWRGFWRNGFEKNKKKKTPPQQTPQHAPQRATQHPTQH